MLYQHSNYITAKKMHITKEHVILVGLKPFG